MSAVVPPPGVQAPPPLPPGPVPSLGPVVLVRLIGGLVTAVLLIGGAFSIGVQFMEQRLTTVTGFKEVTSVVIATSAGDVDVRPAATGGPDLLRTTTTWTRAQPQVTSAVAGGVLTITAKCPSQRGPGSCAADLQLSVAPGTSVQVTAGRGDIRATAGTTVVATSRAGDIHVASSEATKVSAEGGTGDVSVTGAAAGATVEARTGTGDARVTLTTAPSAVTVDTGTGDAFLRVPAGDAYRVIADTGLGDREVTVPQSHQAPRTIDIRVGIGDIDAGVGAPASPLP